MKEHSLTGPCPACEESLENAAWNAALDAAIAAFTDRQKCGQDVHPYVFRQLSDLRRQTS